VNVTSLLLPLLLLLPPLLLSGGHNVALEIQATLPRTEAHPSTVKPMMKGINITFVSVYNCSVNKNNM
jgi:hypothetical protein